MSSALHNWKRTSIITVSNPGRKPEKQYNSDLNEQTEAMFSRLVKQFSEKEGVTEALKAENQMLWVQRMNNRRRLFLFRQYSISHKVP